ncbi:hypothetical protein CYMTET_11549 [Cymbomonas tetramitiformis]|uniref:Uncharacterized protein n=1 Tax=Cymbomonas tetramitiformis TaxID=36881 RepID=A0AAE0GM42_9CHLO|nr:hypothetical protein CYMTET_11549 [Cymbomonas tetramitiformis]
MDFERNGHRRCSQEVLEAINLWEQREQSMEAELVLAANVKFTLQEQVEELRKQLYAAREAQQGAEARLMDTEWRAERSEAVSAQLEHERREAEERFNRLHAEAAPGLEERVRACDERRLAVQSSMKDAEAKRRTENQLGDALQQNVALTIKMQDKETAHLKEILERENRLLEREKEIAALKEAMEMKDAHHVRTTRILEKRSAHLEQELHDIYYPQAKDPTGAEEEGDVEGDVVTAAAVTEDGAELHADANSDAVGATSADGDTQIVAAPPSMEDTTSLFGRLPIPLPPESPCAAPPPPPPLEPILLGPCSNFRAPGLLPPKIVVPDDGFQTAVLRWSMELEDHALPQNVKQYQIRWRRLNHADEEASVEMLTVRGDVLRREHSIRLTKADVEGLGSFVSMNFVDMQGGISEWSTEEHVPCMELDREFLPYRRIPKL